MQESQLAWNAVWKQSHKTGSYSYTASRIERALDKIGHYVKKGILFRPGERVLEAGCGDGLIILTLRKLFRVEGHGVDFSSAALDQSEKLMTKLDEKFSFRLADIRQLPYADNYFDKVISLGVVEHMEDPMPAIRELQRVLRPGGQLILMTPNVLSAGFFDRIFKQAFGLWSFGYQTEFTSKTLEKMVLDAGFKSPLSEVVVRDSMPRDNATFKVISIVDRAINIASRSWGFYSYVYATK